MNMKNASKILLALLMSVTFSTAVFAEVAVEIAVDGNELSVDEQAEVSDTATELVPDVSCAIDFPLDRIYDSELVSVRRKLKVAQGEEFEVKVFIKNTGNMPWFNGDYCQGPWAYLGTERTRDRSSIFYAEGLAGWEGTNRIEMDQPRVNPGAVASFSFTAKAPMSDEVFKEYFALTMKDLLWVEGSTFDFDVIVGNPSDSASDLRKKIAYAGASGSVSAINLNAEKRVVIDRSDQTMKIYLGDMLVREFRVSTGAADTPTPIGEFSISLKQEVRVGSKPPHYIMPKFQWFKAGGYGIHALPQLKGNNWFWEEALDHIGIPVSHGCVRVLPADADWLFSFTDIGTKVIVQQ